MTDAKLNRRLLIGASLAMPAALAVEGQAHAAAAPGSLVVIAEIVAKPERAVDLRKILTTFAGGARKEKGCISYALYEDREHPGHFYTYETWENDAALDAHLASPAMKGAAVQLAAILAAPPAIRRMTPLNVG